MRVTNDRCYDAKDAVLDPQEQERQDTLYHEVPETTRGFRLWQMHPLCTRAQLWEAADLWQDWSAEVVELQRIYGDEWHETIEGVQKRDAARAAFRASLGMEPES